MPRVSIYISDRRDLDILNALDNIPEGDRSWYLKELLRDGLRYRNGIEPPVGFIGRSTQVIFPGAPNPYPTKQEPESTPEQETTDIPKQETESKPKKKVVKKAKTTKKPVEEPEVTVVEEVPVEPRPVTVPQNPMDIFANIDIESLKQDEDDDDELDDKLDSL